MADTEYRIVSAGPLKDAEMVRREREEYLAENDGLFLRRLCEAVTRLERRVEELEIQLGIADDDG